MAATGGSYNPPSVVSGSETDDQQLEIFGGQLVLEDGGAPINLDEFGDNDELTDAFGNPIPQ